MVGIVRLARRMMQSDFRQRALECVLIPLLAAAPHQLDYYQVVPAEQDRPLRRPLQLTLGSVPPDHRVQPVLRRLLRAVRDHRRPLNAILVQWLHVLLL